MINQIQDEHELRQLQAITDNVYALYANRMPTVIAPALLQLEISAIDYEYL